MLELLEILQFQLPESHNDLSQSLHALKDDLKVCPKTSVKKVVLVSFILTGHCSTTGLGNYFLSTGNNYLCMI